MSIKVLVVDDSALIREVLTRMLARDGDITVVGTAIDPIEAREKIKELIEDSWKDMVGHCVVSTEQQPLAVPHTVVNFARTVNNMYKHGDAFTSSHDIKETIMLLYVKPIG